MYLKILSDVFDYLIIDINNLVIFRLVDDILICSVIKVNNLELLKAELGI